MDLTQNLGVRFRIKHTSSGSNLEGGLQPAISDAGE
jgi:hypothetical protein